MSATDMVRDIGNTDANRTTTKVREEGYTAGNYSAP